MRAGLLRLGCAVLAAVVVAVPVYAQSANSPQQFLELWGRAWDDHNVNAMVRLHADDCVTVNRFGVAASGRDEVRRSLAWLHNGPFRTAHFAAPRLLDQRKLAPGWIALHAAWASPSGKASPPEEELLVTYLLRNFPGEGWLAEQVDVHAVAPLAGAAAPAPSQP